MRTAHLLGLGLVLATAGGLTACAGHSTCDGVGELCRVAGSGDQAAGADGQLAVKTALYWVSAVKVGPDGRVYVMDQNNYKLHVVTADGTLETVAGTGIHSGAIAGALATQSPFLDPIDFAWRPDGRLVIVSWHDSRLVEIGLDGTIDVVAGEGVDNAAIEGCAGTGDGGPALAAGFCELRSIAIDAKGRMFLADDAAQQVRMIDTDGTISTIVGDGNPAYDGDGGPAAQAHIDEPKGLAIDNDGNLLIADSFNHVIRKVDMTTRLISTVVGNHTRGFAGDGGPCLAAEMDQPAGIAVDTDGVLYVADTYNNRMRKVDLAGDVVQTVAGNGSLGLAGDDGQALSAEFHNPTTLSITGGTLYIADTLNNVARSIRLR